MDRLAIEEVHRQNPVYREPPRKWRNSFRAGLIILTAALLAGLIFFACYLVYQRNFISPQQRGYVLKSEHSIPYPQTKRAVANRFGGSLSGWHRYGNAGWVYDGDTPLEITHRQNVTMFTTHASFYWE